jgi:hypothetical protein
MERHSEDASEQGRSPRWEVYEIVAELIEQRAKAPPSRNRHFEAWQDTTRAAYRLYSRLLDIRDDLQRLQRDGGTPTAAREASGDVHLVYALEQIPQGPVTRRAELTGPEWELLAAVCGALTPEVVPA